MQPIYSVDHESRQSSGRVEEEDRAEPSTEDTPLLHRFPQPDASARHRVNVLMVTILLMILLTGIAIGTYLLVLQSDSENILPPVEAPLQLVSRRQWDPLQGRPLLGASAANFRAKHVIIVQTSTRECVTTESCIKLLREIKANTTATGTTVPYNFAVSSDGHTYEVMGWHHPSPLFPEYPSALVLAFIGNYVRIPPTREQLQETNNWIAVSLSQQHLEPDYVVIGKTIACKPLYLFNSMAGLQQWNRGLSDM